MINKRYNIAISGATGLVGRTMLKVLEQRNFPVGNLKLLASGRSAGVQIPFKNDIYTVQEISGDSFEDIDIALFSAGKDVSVQFADAAARSGCVVIDNGSYWRMHPEVPLVVPEVNPDALNKHYGIIANPNCSTIQLVVPLKSINDKYTLKRVVVSTYQSISGAGQKGIDQLNSEIAGQEPASRVTSHQIAFNTVFHKITEEFGYSEEELKMINETRKILGLANLSITMTCVRLPILGGHGESVNIETELPFSLQELKDSLSSSNGIIIKDKPELEIYPTPKDANGTDEVYIGRIRRDNSIENGLNLWIVADNVRKGAASNAVQIAEKLIETNNLNFEYKNIKY